MSGISNFAIDLYKALTQNETDFQENCFFSPVSLYAAFAALMAGTGGKSETELRKFLHADAATELSKLHDSIGKELNKLTASSVETKVAMSNCIFVDNGSSIHQSFIKRIKDCYKSEPQNMNFSSEPENCREKINKWAAQNTENKIQNLFGSGSINQDTKFVIANALYFKGLWKTPFDKSETHDGPFRLLDGTKKQVPMMSLRDKRMGYSEFESMDAQAVFLPFTNSNLNMFILLPNDHKGLPSLMKKLFEEGNNFAGEKQLNLTMFLSTANYGSDKVDLFLPRFKVGGEPSLTMNSFIKAMGVHDIFDHTKADFSGICDGKNLVVSTVVHQAVLEVDETGAEAAAATGIGIMCMSMPMPPQQFNVDHPFIVAIADDNKIPLFLGHVSNPQ